MKKLVLVFSILGLMCGCGGGGGGKSTPPAISVSLAPATQTTIDQGQTLNFTATVANDSSGKGVTWSVSGTTCTGAACGTFTNTAATTATYNAPTPVSSNLTVSVQATSVADTTKSASSSVVVTPPPSITTTSLANGTVGTAYSETLQATGGAGTLTWSVATGSSLPSWLSLSSGGVLSGTPTTPATSTFTVKVTDASGGQPGPLSAQKQLSLTINPAPLTITTTSLSNGVVGTAYSASVVASGGTVPYTWSITSGSLPGGLSLNASTGAISGTPTAGGTTSFTVTATDSGTPPQTVNQALSITINPLLAITTTAVPNGVVSMAYSATLQSTGGVGTITWSITSGSLPAGLTISSSGTISGTPTTTGTSSFTVTAKDSGTPQQTVKQPLSITVYTGLTIITTSLPNGTVNSAYSATLQSAGGVGTITWSVTTGSLPVGLTLSSSGTISGTPTTAGTTNFTVTATDSGTPPQTKSQALSITVNPMLSITTTSLPSGTVGIAYSQNIQTSGGTLPITWSVTSGSLPSGLSLGSSTGAISGTPTATGTYPFTVTATDSSIPPQSVSQPLSITINNVPLSIITTPLPGAVLNTAYNETLTASGGTKPYTWSVTVGSLPAGLNLSTSGTISGTPTATGTSTFTVTVTDSSTPKQSQSEQLSIGVSATACGTGNESILSGQYAFSLSGFNATGYLAVVGSFTADGTGKITAGEADTNGALGVQQANITTSASSYSVGADNRGCATIATSFGTFATRFALGTVSSGKATEGRVIEWETGSSAFIATGHILQQTASSFSSGVSSNYVFEETGVDPVHRLSGVGVISVSGGSVTSGELDMNDAGTLINDTVVTGTYTSPDTNGRFTMTATWTSLGPSHQVFYMVSSSQVLFLSTDPQVLAGEGTQQTVPAGGFTNSSLNGPMVFYTTGLTSSGSGGRAEFGLASGNGSGSLAVTDYVDNAGTWSTPNPDIFTCTTSVASNGRMTLSGANCTNAPVFYLVAANTAFMLGEGSGVEIGQVEPQVVPSGGFTTASFSGTYYMGTLGVANQAVNTGVAVLTVTASGYTMTSDYTETVGQTPDKTETGATGAFTVNSNGIVSLAGVVEGILISSTELVLVDNVSSTYPTIVVVKQ